METGKSSFNTIPFQTPSIQGVTTTRVDFFESEYDKVIQEKGREVLVEKALKCPCKSIGTNQQSDCKNCGGSGWIFYNPTKTKLLLQAMSITNESKPWSEEERGTINVTSSHQEELSYMDRITVLDGQSIHQEVLHFKENKDSILFSYTSYNVIEILYIGLFQSSTEKLLVLEENKDYTVRNNRIILNKVHSNNLQYEGEYNYDKDAVSVTIRYKHCPTYHIIEMKRETMQSYKLEAGVERVINLPVSAIARKANYIMNSQLLTTERVLNNNFIKPTPTTCYPIEHSITISTPVSEVIIERNSLNFNKILSYQIKDIGEQPIEDYYVEATNTSLIIHFNSLFLGIIILTGI